MAQWCNGERKTEWGREAETYNIEHITYNINVIGFLRVNPCNPWWIYYRHSGAMAQWRSGERLMTAWDLVRENSPFRGPGGNLGYGERQTAYGERRTADDNERARWRDKERAWEGDWEMQRLNRITSAKICGICGNKTANGILLYYNHDNHAPLISVIFIFL